MLFMSFCLSIFGLVWMMGVFGMVVELVASWARSLHEEYNVLVHQEHYGGRCAHAKPSARVATKRSRRTQRKCSPYARARAFPALECTHAALAAVVIGWSQKTIFLLGELAQMLRDSARRGGVIVVLGEEEEARMRHALAIAYPEWGCAISSPPPQRTPKKAAHYCAEIPLTIALFGDRSRTAPSP